MQALVHSDSHETRLSLRSIFVLVPRFYPLLTSSYKSNLLPVRIGHYKSCRGSQKTKKLALR